MQFQPNQFVFDLFYKLNLYYPFNKYEREKGNQPEKPKSEPSNQRISAG